MLLNIWLVLKRFFIKKFFFYVFKVVVGSEGLVVKIVLVSGFWSIEVWKNEVCKFIMFLFFYKRRLGIFV